MYCSSNHFKKLNYESLKSLLRRDFTEFDWGEFDCIAAQPYFKSVVSGVQDIEYIIDPALQRS